MNYYYEVKLNFNDKLYSFYEWSNNDKYELAKKIPLIKIKSSILKNIISNEIKINDEFLKLIEDKTICKGNTKIKYACIFCDTKNCIAIEFNKDGYSIARSNLLLEDDNNICELSYTLKNKNIEFININRINTRSEFRQEIKIKKIISKELLELYRKDDSKKLEYIFYEWFNEIEIDKKVMLKKMYEDLKNGLKKEHYDIYKIIKLSYSKI